VDSQTKLGRVRVALPVRPDLRPGGFGRATFTAASAAVATVPETAILYDATGASVAVVGDDKRVQIVEVKTGRRAQGYVELVQGPPAGAWIVLRGGSFVLPGDLVKPVRRGG
jgi:HlyD family secretion protein